MTRTARRAFVAVTVPALLLGVGWRVERSDRFAVLRFAVRRDGASMASTRMLPAGEVERGVPTISVVVADADLYDAESGLLTHTLGRGTAWERPALVSFFDKGRLVFASGAGIRVHGGGSRLTSPNQSFRLYFRPRYGAQRIDSRRVFDNDVGLIRALVLHNDVRVDRAGRPWHFVNPLAYDIARRLGGVTPETRPARFFLNGRFQGVYVLTERINEDFFAEHFGTPEIRGTAPEDAELERALYAWLEDVPLTVSSIEERVDLDNLTAWFLAVVFSATGDLFQAPGQLFDAGRTSGNWFWVLWDMDQSFMDHVRNTGRPWSQDTFASVLTVRPRRGRSRGEPRAFILRGLLTRDPEYRRMFHDRFTVAMNHLLTPAFLEERFDHYAGIARRYGVEDVRYLPVLRTFLAQRPRYLWAQAARRLGRAGRVRATFTAPPATRLWIDEHEVAPGFQGSYFRGTVIRIRARPPSGMRVTHWRINDTLDGLNRNGLAVRLDDDTRIATVLGPRTGRFP